MGSLNGLTHMLTGKDVDRENYLNARARTILHYPKKYLTRRHHIFGMRLSFGTSLVPVVILLGGGTSAFRLKANSHSRKGK